jgi:hypothetical protein
MTEHFSFVPRRKVQTNHSIITSMPRSSVLLKPGSQFALSVASNSSPSTRLAKGKFMIAEVASRYRNFLSSYRYDGLYRVEKVMKAVYIPRTVLLKSYRYQAWLDDGLEGFKVCKFAFKRLDGQPPLPVRGDHESEEESSANDDEDADS